MKKNVIICLALLISTLGFSQLNSIEKNNDATYSNEEIKLRNLSIEVTVDSAKDIESTFTTKGIKELIDESGEGEDISFEIICNNKNSKDGLKSHASYKAKGNTDDKKTFLKLIKKIKKAAIKYYNN